MLALLTHRLAPGVWQIDRKTDDIASIEHFAAGLGWDVRTFATDNDKAATIESVGRAARVPSYVRSNWDSLNDGLRDISQPRNNRLLLIADAAAVTANDNVLIEILDDAARFWGGHGVRFYVLWVGPGASPRLEALEPIRASRRG